MADQREQCVRTKMRPVKVLDSAITGSTQAVSHILAGEYSQIMSDSRNNFIQWNSLLADPTYGTDFTGEFMRSWETGGYSEIWMQCQTAAKDILRSLQDHGGRHSRFIVEPTLRHWRRLRALRKESEPAGSVIDGCKIRQHSLLTYGAVDGRFRLPIGLIYAGERGEVSNGFSRESISSMQTECIAAGCHNITKLRDSYSCLGCGETYFCSKSCAASHLKLIFHSTELENERDVECVFPHPSVCCSQDCSDLQRQARKIVMHWRLQASWPLVLALCPRRNGGIATVPVHVRVAIRNWGMLPSTLLVGLSDHDAELLVHTPWAIERCIQNAEMSSACCAEGCGNARRKHITDRPRARGEQWLHRGRMRQ